MSERIELQHQILEDLKMQKKQLENRFSEINKAYEELDVKPKDTLSQEEVDEMQNLAKERENLVLEMSKIDTQIMEVNKDSANI